VGERAGANKSNALQIGMNRRGYNFPKIIPELTSSTSLEP
jgi:hypothetical protein